MDLFSDSEKEDTDGYLSEDIDTKRYQKSLFRKYSAPKLIKADDIIQKEKSDKKLSETPQTQTDTNKSDKVKRSKSKSKSDKKSDRSDDNNSDKDKK